MGAIYIINHNESYRSANINPRRILIPSSSLETLRSLEFSSLLPLRVYADQSLPTNVVIAGIPEV